MIKQTRQKLQGTAAEGLSAADLIALAGAHAVAITGGPRITVPVGREDAVAADPAGLLPMETLSAEAQIDTFADKGLSVQELVALLGAHTVRDCCVYRWCRGRAVVAGSLLLQAADIGCWARQAWA